MKKEIRLRIQLLFLFLITIQTITTACSCWPYESVFCRSVTPWHNVVSVVVTEHLEFHLMEVKIIENINEEIAEDTIVIYGQDGLTCGELLNQFEFQDTLILAVTISGREKLLFSISVNNL